MEDFGLTRQELRALRALRSPVGIQRALDGLPYHLAKTAWSPRRVLRDRAHPGWMSSDADLWWIPEHLVHVPHRHLLTPAMEQSLSRVDRRALEAGLVGYRAH